ncbi:MAG: hypothetical protein EXS03_01475 [Phycisphaerales bacterium]|nr:hypothetical protein [Phycisphaerales bacterium]
MPMTLDGPPTHAAPTPRVPKLGELLVAQGLLTEREVDEVLAAQLESNRPFGALCEEMFGVDPSLVEGAWVDQYRALAASFDADFARVHPAALARVSARQAWQFRVVPLRLDHETLVMATTPTHLARASRFASSVLGTAALFVVVDTHELSDALTVHYPIGGLDVRAVRSGVSVNGNSRT